VQGLDGKDRRHALVTRDSLQEEGVMAGRSGGLLSAGLMVVLTLGGSACGYDRSSAPNGPGYGDTAKMSAVVGRSDGGNLDLAVMDDYLYSEPQTIR
jgi:hypothetical protein